MNRKTPNPYDTFASKQHGKLITPSSSDVFFTPKKKKRKFGRFFLVLIVVLLSLMLLYGILINLFVRVSTVTASIPQLPSDFEGYTILHISDLYGGKLGKEHARLTRALDGRRYDAVCITGDMLLEQSDPQTLYDLLDLIKTDTPIYFIAGEQDPAPLLTDGGEGSVLAPYVLGAQQRGAVYLDAPVHIERGQSSLFFAPESAMSLDALAARTSIQAQIDSWQTQGDQPQNTLASMQLLEYQLDRAERIYAAQQEMTTDDVCIALTHAPLQSHFIKGLSGTGDDTTGRAILGMIDLTLAGHYNGGQVQLPFIGPVYISSLGFFPGRELTQGLAETNTLLQHISPGLGVNPHMPIPFRFFNPPTVTLIRLTADI